MATSNGQLQEQQRIQVFYGALVRIRSIRSAAGEGDHRSKGETFLRSATGIKYI